ncbi:LysE family translocator [Endozoicomonas sp. SCSIO W0465]|uniref:LysE family translocator n=1 Tax=Endozoicomonas sp. SCSIO W0465 TaxID=2918516 RepID=UPI0020758DF2|nr:LysE family translocator [Endozoicomonas sp. SCSIO W0465]USE35829.1 LysE family translocator [Endozoicomonas sp. SCSIO W0465]
MITVEAFITLGLASILLSLAPGPDNIFVLTQSALHGRKAGFFVTLGLCTGLIFHTAAVAFGVAAIFQTSVLAFNILKLIGAAYLIYLAWQAFKAPGKNINSAGRSDPVTPIKLYFRGIIMNITNPKVSIFFLAFLPQFASPESGAIAPQIFVLGFIFILVTLLVFNIISLLSSMLGAWLSGSKKAQLYLNKISGTVFLGLALKLATSEVKI